MGTHEAPPPVRATAVEVAIIGSGFAGLGMAIALRSRGETDFVVLEKASSLGGTWRDNHYPGCACDVQSHLYSFSFAPNPAWSRMFSPQAEIQAYLQGCAERFALTPYLRFNREVAEARWDERSATWQLVCTNGERYSARVLIGAMGGLSRPALPTNIPGLECFAGRTFHSQDWDHGYALAGRRVAVIGTGASAIQFVPQIQPSVTHLDLYQRTPPWIVPKPDRRVSARERWMFERFPIAQRLYRYGLYWMLEFRVLGFAVNPKLMRLLEKLARRHLARQVGDPALRAKLTPDYTLGCKRVLISNDYYRALDKPNVEVITRGIREVRANSIVDASGHERATDAIIFGTGFKATDPVPHGMLFGRDGKDLAEAWKDGPEAYKGTTVSGFPNLFLLVGPNTGLGHNSMILMIESQVAYVLEALRFLRQRKVAAIDVRADVQARHNQHLQRALRRTVWGTGGCKSWYLHPSGKNTTLWPGATWRFRAKLRRFDAAAYDVSTAPRDVGSAGVAAAHT